MLADVLTVSRTTVSLDQGDKTSVLRAMAELFAEEGVGLDASTVLRVFLEREALACTGIGSGVAIPHGRIAGIAEVRAALGIHRAGVSFDAVDGQPVHILVGVLAPESAPSQHLRTLAEISRRLRDDAVRASLVSAPDSATAHRILTAP